MKNSRTLNTIYNFISSVGGQLITVIMQFIVRTVFIHTLGEEYLGINGLFSNILSMLSIAELGVGSAILYKLYDPIAKENYSRISALMSFYKNAYRIIGLVVAVLGIILIPFLPYLINDYSKLEFLNINVTFIFLLYLFKSVSSYLFFSYRSAFIKANQKEYIVNLVSYFFTIGMGLCQILFLIMFPKIEIYVFISVLQVILQNIACGYLAVKMYPYINKRSSEKVKKDEIIQIFKDCSAIFLYKLNTVVLNATDNIILSIYLGLTTVAKYSNYYIFYTTIHTLFNKIFNSVSHSLGNLHTDNNKKHEYEVFQVVCLISAILGGTACVGIAVCADEFIQVWIGDQWIIKQPFSILLGIELYTMAIRGALSRYRNTMGLFQQAKYRPLFGMIINLVVSLIAVQFIGIYGVLLGTIVADWTTFMWFDPIIIHKYGFNQPNKIPLYFKKTIKYFLIIIVVGVFDYVLCKTIFLNLGWGSLIIHAAVCGITVPVSLVASCLKDYEGIYVYKLGRKYMNKITKKFLK